MKNLHKLLFIICLNYLGYSNNWVNIKSDTPSGPAVSVQSNSLQEINIAFDFQGYYVTKISNKMKALSFPGSVPKLDKGAPKIPLFTKSIQIPDLAKMKLDIKESVYVDIPFDNLAPSKGNLTRDINPSEIQFEFGQVYEKNEFYPSRIAFLRDPYIVRNIRGQTIVFQPLQYNPVKKILRVYKSINLEIKSDGISQINPLIGLPKVNSSSREFDAIFQNHFINYNQHDIREERLQENGRMLVLSHPDFIPAMEPFVNWKNMKGIQTEIASIEGLGDAESIKSFVENYYYENGLVYLLLVGDIDQIPSPRFSIGAGSNSPADPNYSFIAGDDYYPEIFVGRFSAENISHVNTMVSRTITYEKYPSLNGQWYHKGSGFASNEGPGDNNEYDDEHLNVIRSLLLDYTFTEVDQVYDPLGSVFDGEQAINDGRSIINYTGHGSSSSWGNGCPMNNTNVNGLSNFNKWPYIWSVACVNGEFHLGTCFAETWLRATDNQGNPTGAIATLMSTVNQAWNPPMNGQDRMNEMLVESISNDKLRSFGGLSLNGCMIMNDNYGNDGNLETLYWTIFGDPSFNVRTDTPSELLVEYENFIIMGQELFLVNSVPGAIVAISKNGTLISSGIIDASGSAILPLLGAADTPSEISIVVTAYNTTSYIADIDIIAPDGPYMMLNSFQTGNENQVINGQNVDLFISVENVGSESSGSIYARLLPSNNDVHIIVDSLAINNIGSGQLADFGPYEFQVPYNIENQTDLHFLLEISTGEEAWESSINLNVNSPVLTILSTNINDNHNGALDPGESAQVSIILKNIGQSHIDYPNFNIHSSNEYIVLGAVTYTNDLWWGPDMDLVLNFDINVNDNVSIGSTPIIWVTIGSVGTDYNSNIPVPFTVGLLLENFETNGFTSHNWQLLGSNNWFLQNQEVFEGGYSLASGNIEDNQESSLEVSYNVLFNGELSFFSKVSCEGGASQNPKDFLGFYIDNELQTSISGESDWQRYSYIIPSGEHTFRWTYQKDAATSVGQDMAWLDNIIFPSGSIPPLNINFGDLNSDSNVNVLDVVLTVSSILGYSSLSDDQIINADINMDGEVNIIDINLIIELLFQD